MMLIDIHQIPSYFFDIFLKPDSYHSAQPNYLISQGKLKNVTTEKLSGKTEKAEVKKVTIVRVNAGACRFKARIEVFNTGNYIFETKIETDCPYIQKLQKDLTSFNLLEEVKNVFGVQIRDLASKHILGSCVGCIVPSAILKAAQKDAGLALARNVDIVFE
jgi:Family of unknown function (DUF6951)